MYHFHDTSHNQKLIIIICEYKDSAYGTNFYEKSIFSS